MLTAVSRYFLFHAVRGLPVSVKVKPAQKERAVALPLHAHLTEEQVAFIVGTMKDASINLGAGAAIYL